MTTKTEGPPDGFRVAVGGDLVDELILAKDKETARVTLAALNARQALVRVADAADDVLDLIRVAGFIEYPRCTRLQAMIASIRAGELP